MVTLIKPNKATCLVLGPWCYQVPFPRQNVQPPSTKVSRARRGVAKAAAPLPRKSSQQAPHDPCPSVRSFRVQPLVDGLGLVAPGWGVGVGKMMRPVGFFRLGIKLGWVKMCFRLLRKSVFNKQMVGGKMMFFFSWWVLRNIYLDPKFQQNGGWLLAGDFQISKNRFHGKNVSNPKKNITAPPKQRNLESWLLEFFGMFFGWGEGCIVIVFIVLRNGTLEECGGSKFWLQFQEKRWQSWGSSLGMCIDFR